MRHSPSGSSVKVAGGPEAAQAMLAGESLEATPDEMRDALVDRYGDSLTQEQLDALAGGADDATIVNLGIIGVVAGAAAAAAV